jgi:hypothetical protein
MSEEDDWEFAGADDTKMTLRAAVKYLLRGTTDGIRGDILQAIISIVRQVAAECRPSSQILWTAVCVAGGLWSI